MLLVVGCLFFFFKAAATTEIYTLSLHDALPIYMLAQHLLGAVQPALDDRADLVVDQLLRLVRHPHRLRRRITEEALRSEEHTSELQSRENLVCRLLLEKKKSEDWTPTASPTQDR